VKLFVGNLNLQTTSEDLNVVFQAFGAVKTAVVMMNPTTGEGHGYGFVEMLNDADALSAMQNLDGYRFMERPLRVLRQTAISHP
jgi:RNA recognition motif-containing protein